MCRSIKTLREPFTEVVTETDIEAAALQYVRKISGFRAPAAHNREVFERAVRQVTEATAALLDGLVVRTAPSSAERPHSHGAPSSGERPHAHATASPTDRPHSHPAPGPTERPPSRATRAP